MTRCLALLALLFSCLACADEPLFPNSDFETGTLEGWEAEGDAFSRQPTKGDNTLARQRETSGHQGEFWIGTYENFDGRDGQPGAVRGDGAKGTLTSPEFKITKPFVTFLVGGGNLPGETGVKLVCDGEEFELSTGVDSETMVWTSYDVSSLIGKSAQLIVFDDVTEGWGHINVDAFTATDKPVAEVSGEFALARGISAEVASDIGYDQALRPQFHFTARKNWLNDPNGMVYDGQNYHLFFQHNPLGTKWGNMTWGHAISPGAIHWKQLDHALLPYQVDRRNGTIFSGTAVVDHNNSLGKQVGETKTLVAFYTFAARPAFYQAMAYSTDGGMNWTYWNEGRAVVPNQGFDEGERDPKVFWHEASQQWVMVLWVQSNPGRIRFFTSQNLADWNVASDLMRDWAFECMDVVFLPVDGDTNNVKAVIYDASYDYEIGTFDGQIFHSETPALQTSGGNFYAAQTFNNAPDGRAIQIGWMRGGPDSAEAYGVPFNQQMSFPCEMSLRTTQAGVRLFCEPIAEIASLVKRTHTHRDVELGAEDDLLSKLGPLDLVDLSIDFDPGTAQQIVFEFPSITLTYDVKKQILSHNGVSDEGEPREVNTLSDLSPRNGIVSLRLLIDRLSVETFAFAGESFSAHYYSPKTGSGKQAIRAVGGKAHVKRLQLNELKSAW